MTMVQIWIKSEGKHVERMCVRGSDMAMDSQANKYVRNIARIRTIQDYLVRSAEKAAVPKVANGNVDVSLSAIHATVLAVLRRYAPARCGHVLYHLRVSILIDTLSIATFQRVRRLVSNARCL